jgi:APA family basic amino acid/polyamine antiporter
MVSADARGAALVPRLGTFHTTMLVMGGIVGSGIFVNPHVVALSLASPVWILAAWATGGAIALAGAFVYAELARRFRGAGGQYVYLRETYHPAVAFLYGWCLLLVVQSGGMAAVAVTFARYAPRPDGVSEATVAVAVLAALTLVNCSGVVAGAWLQSLLMVLKIGAIAALALAGIGAGRLASLAPSATAAGGGDGLLAFAAALTPVLFAYGGWQTASFVAEEMEDPARNLRRGLLWGVLGVIALYLAVNVACLMTLGAEGLRRSDAPARDVMLAALGPAGARAIGLAIALSALGFLAQSMLTAPRVYFAMARDGLFFERFGRPSPRTRVPVAAIVLQGVAAALVALSGRYEQILSYVVAVDFVWFGLTGLALFVLGRGSGADAPKVPGHPLTTLVFVAACFAVAAASVAHDPVHGGIGLAILAAGVPVAFAWARRRR